MNKEAPLTQPTPAETRITVEAASQLPSTHGVRIQPPDDYGMIYPVIRIEQTHLAETAYRVVYFKSSAIITEKVQTMVGRDTLLYAPTVPTQPITPTCCDGNDADCQDCTRYADRKAAPALNIEPTDIVTELQEAAVEDLGEGWGDGTLDLDDSLYGLAADEITTLRAQLAAAQAEVVSIRDAANVAIEAFKADAAQARGELAATRTSPCTIEIEVTRECIDGVYSRTYRAAVLRGDTEVFVSEGGLSHEAARAESIAYIAGLAAQLGGEVE